MELISTQPIYGPLEVLQDWWIGLVAFLVSLVATPIVRFIAYRTKVVDRPDALLKPHARPIAYMGGVAMCFGMLVGLGCYLAIMPDRAAHWDALGRDLSALRWGDVLRNPVWNLLAIALSSVLITVVGLLDDILNISPKQKVFGQLLAAAVLLVGGVGTRMSMMFLAFLHLPVPIWLVIPSSAVVCIVMVIATCNATNLLDGLDGLCGGVTGIIALGFLALAVWLAMWGHQPDSDPLRVALCLAVAGAVLGFLPYNIPPASIFMGDAGSMLLGFFVATMMALFCRERNARWFVAAWAVFALPTLDTGLAVIRRLIGGKSIFAGDRSHLYDQLVDRGMTVKQVVVLFYFLAAVAAAIGVLVAIYVRGRYALAIYAVLLLIVFWVFYRLGMVHPEDHSGSPEPRQGDGDGEGE